MEIAIPILYIIICISILFEDTPRAKKLADYLYNKYQK